MLEKEIERDVDCNVFILGQAFINQKTRKTLEDEVKNKSSLALWGSVLGKQLN